MPGIKRAFVSGDEDEEDSNASETASSSPESDSRKRSKVSQGPQGNGYDSDATDDELHEWHASQIYEKQRSQSQRENQPAENGIIESVTCTNFMCHEFLHVEVGPLINFIIGHNGSGKSAVLTALTISLGGKASATNRGGSLKSFIKEGQDSCTLSVKIKNRGETGYQTDVYGDSIIVERSFNKAGSSSFKLKSSSERIISTRKGDLEDISDYYALQLDNPINVLTQDMARSFLSNSSPQEKYKLFIKGIQLEQLNHDYALLWDNIEQIEGTTADKEAHVQSLKEKATRAKRLVDLASKQDTLRDKMHSLSLQMAWSQVEEQESEFSKIGHEIREVEAYIENTQNEADEASAVLDRAEMSKRRAADALEAAREEMQPVEVERKQAREELASAKHETTEIMNEQRAIANELKASKAAINKANADIAEEERRLEALHGGSHAQRRAELDSCKQNAKMAKQRLEEHKQGFPRLEADRAAALKAVESQKMLRTRKNDEVDECQNRIYELSKSGQKQSGYHPNMEKLRKAIHQDGSYQENPVGPIGEFVRLKTPLWSSVLEKSFGGTLNGFIVKSKQDQTRLSTAMQRSNCSCPIFIASNSDFDFSRNEPEARFKTVLRVLEIDHPLVTRQLVINHAIEQTILVEKMSEARTLMNSTRLTNVRQCYTIHSADPSAGMRFGYGMGDTVQSAHMDSFKGVPRMKTQAQDQVNFEKDRLQYLKSELRECENKLTEKQKSLEACTKSIARHKKEAETLNIAVQRADDEAERVQDELDKDVVEEGRLEVLKEGLAAAEKAKSLHESTYQECVNAKDNSLAKTKTFLDKLNEIDRRVEIAERKVREREAAVENADEERSGALVSKNQAFELLEKAAATRARLEAQKQRQNACVTDFIEQAGKVGPRVPVDRGETSTSIDKKLTKLEEEIKSSEEHLGGDKTKIAQDYQAASKAYNEASIQFQEDKALAKLLKQSHDHRLHRWRQFQQSITARARVMFIHLLSERSFHGRLVINHHAKTLNLNVQPDETQRDKDGRETKTLSGGEKSFSQICFLLAVWEAIGAPIRCLDEFDVFMDSVNREASMRLLIKAARESVGRQFVLITPQSMGSINRAADIKIIKMRDPERNQTTLNL